MTPASVSASARLHEMDAAMPNEPWSRESGEWFKIGLSPVAGTSADALATYRNALPELAALVEAAEQRADAILAEELARLARKLGEQG